MNVLGIETSCDETSASVVKDGKEILSLVIRSQMDAHAAFGGVFPELACRQHLEALLPIVDQSLKEANLKPADLDLIAVTKAPGLIGALMLGVNAAKALAYGWNKPFIGVNHIEAHLYAAMMSNDTFELPGLGLVISGGHTALIQIDAIGQYQTVGGTIDDAIGEAFDKVARLLGLGYPGGPAIEELAKQGNPEAFSFKAGRVSEKPYAFSLSGLKTQVLYAVKGQGNKKESPTLLSDQGIADVAASFQKVACQDVVNKTLKAAAQLDLKHIYVGGGVSNNRFLRELFTKEREKSPKNPIEVHWPAPLLSLDNAAMIAGLGFHRYLLQGHSDEFNLVASPTNKNLFL